MARHISKRSKGNQIGLGATVDATALYIRVSTSKQAEEGFSLEAQKDKLQAYCTAQGWAVADEHVFVDAGLSGKTVERPAFQAMLEAAKAGNVRRVVAMKLDRIGRNVREFLATVDALQRVGVDLVLVKESFDSGTAHGKFALTMFAAIAELEASQITERTMTGRRQKAKEGQFNGGRVALGYTYDGATWQIDKTGAATVRRIFRQFLDGASLDGIAKGLNADHVATAAGGKWYAGTVRYILSNGTYAGLVQYDQQDDVKGEQPAIVGEDEYHAAVARLRALRPGRAAIVGHFAGIDNV